LVTQDVQCGQSGLPRQRRRRQLLRISDNRRLGGRHPVQWSCECARRSSKSVAGVRAKWRRWRPRGPVSSANERPSPLWGRRDDGDAACWSPQIHLAPASKTLIVPRKRVSASINAPIWWITGRFIERTGECHLFPRLRGWSSFGNLIVETEKELARRFAFSKLCA